MDSRKRMPGIMCAGAFVGPDGAPLSVPEGLPNTHMRLYGGAQYHRAMAEFRASVGAIACPDISREEIVNACVFPCCSPCHCHASCHEALTVATTRLKIQSHTEYAENMRKLSKLMSLIIQAHMILLLSPETCRRLEFSNGWSRLIISVQVLSGSAPARLERPLNG